MNLRMKAISALLLAALVPAALTACQKQGTKMKSYAQDGLLGITDVNPNMPTSPTHHTYLADTELMKTTIKQIPQVTGSTISIYGDVANVRLNVPNNLSDRETETVKREAYDKLSKAMPRYTVKVTISHK